MALPLLAWGLRFGRAFEDTLKRRRPQPDDKWHLDEVFVRIRGKLHCLWRAVDQHRTVLDILVQRRRNAKAAKRFFRKRSAVTASLPPTIEPPVAAPSRPGVK